MIKAIIFDIDNTLLDFMTMKSNAISAAVDGMKKNGLNLEKDEAIEKIFNIYNSKGYEHQKVLNEFIFNELGKIDYKMLASGIVEYKIAKEASLSLYPGVKDTLVNLSNFGLKLGILSDAPSREAWIRLYILKIHKMFDEVVTFDDTGFHKPAKEPFKKIKKLLNIDFSDCLMVGDWPERDIKGANQLGMKTAYAKYGSTEIIENSGADYELDTIHEIIEIVKSENNIL
ncbi:MAG: hypothetical protein CMG61_01505 [Candidatus Marinimicrobia bacterium]|nr:hypothetical protein [Candidatus Neomarinimicrobiota bacterium]|tara:strand:+ start:24830 stop:25516 length:687 start_codon:yes stop_codon:yes gene_type:complete